MMLSSTLKQNKWSTKQRWIAQRNVMPFWLLLLLHFLDVQWRSYGRKFWWLWIYIDFESLLLPPYRHPMVSQPSLNTQNGKPIECFTNASTPETWYNIEASCEENPVIFILTEEIKAIGGTEQQYFLAIKRVLWFVIVAKRCHVNVGYTIIKRWDDRPSDLAYPIWPLPAQSSCQT